MNASAAVGATRLGNMSRSDCSPGSCLQNYRGPIGVFAAQHIIDVGGPLPGTQFSQLPSGEFL
jgi:hypothetical protein